MGFKSSAFRMLVRARIDFRYDEKTESDRFRIRPVNPGMRGMIQASYDLAGQVYECLELPDGKWCLEPIDEDGHRGIQCVVAVADQHHFTILE